MRSRDAVRANLVRDVLDRERVKVHVVARAESARRAFDLDGLHLAAARHGLSLAQRLNTGMNSIIAIDESAGGSGATAAGSGCA
jgi:hypothetical protein